MKSFNEFTKLNFNDKAQLLKEEGVFLDMDTEDNVQVNLYFLKGFYVEETLNRSEKKVVDLIPFKKGYKISSYMKVHEIISEIESLLSA